MGRGDGDGGNGKGEMGRGPDDECGLGAVGLKRHLR